MRESTIANNYLLMELGWSVSAGADGAGNQEATGGEGPGIQGAAGGEGAGIQGTAGDDGAGNPGAGGGEGAGIQGAAAGGSSLAESGMMAATLQDSYIEPAVRASEDIPQ